MTTRNFASLALGSLLVLGAIPTARAEPAIQAGQLICKGGVGFGLLVISSKGFDCTFTPADGRRPHYYRGRVTNLGVDIGITGPTILMWTVLASTNSLKAGHLEGQYLGAGAEASLGVGAGAKLLIGGFKKSIALQPLSVQGQTGVNIAYGVAGLRLRAK
jgi:hypothetical protein